MTRDDLEAFSAAAAPLMRWLAKHLHPHHTAIVTSTNAELLEGQLSTGQTMRFVEAENATGATAPQTRP